MTESTVGERLAYVFPGQGSQAVGMGRDLFTESKAAKETFEEADDILGFSLSKLCFEGPDEQLKQTVNAQPAIMTASIAALRALGEVHGETFPSKPRFVAGHSLGEYTALVAANALPFNEALGLVRERGRLMQEAERMREGGMAAILGLDESLVEQVCQQVGIEIANINSDGQIVLSGTKEALVRAIDLARAMGAKRAIPLEVSGAFHSSLMQPAVPGMAQAIYKATIRNPQVPIISNTKAEPIARQGEIQAELIDQMVSCVRWTKSVEYMAANGVKTFVEIGPGKVLTGLIKRIAKEAQTLNVESMPSVRAFALPA
ncbi:MAG: ACP S-malonyltransferase [Chloroflexi bacterium]|nr:ACP S-malonyltransferase [Chloroflexota bacterium]